MSARVQLVATVAAARWLARARHVGAGVDCL